jgi:diguanylate cyclase (GGDEF)-like protein
MVKNDVSNKNSRIIGIVIILVWLVVFMVMILGIVFPVVFFISLKRVYLNEQRVMVSLSVKYIDDFFTQKQAFLSTMAESDVMRDSSYFGEVERASRGVPLSSALAQRRFLDSALVHYPSFRFFALLTPDTARPILLEPYQAQTALSEDQYVRGYMYREWAQETVSHYRNWDRQGSVPSYIANAFISQPGNVPAISISVGVVNDRKELSGILYANISLETLSSFIKSLAYGKTGKVYLVDAAGNLLAHPDISPGIETKDKDGVVQWTLRDFSKNPVVKNAIENRYVSGFYSMPGERRLVLASYAKIPGLGWTVVVEQDANEAFSIVRIYTYVIILLVLLTLGGSLLSFILISRETAETTRRHRELLVISETDALTGLLNRRSMLSRMSQLIADYELNGQGFVIAMFDIDDFKQVNDTYGHVFGDVVLREIASRTVSILRVEDLLFRWGGEEFLLVIRNCDIVRARGVAEKIRRVVSDTPINDGVTSVTVTVTLGLCQFRGGSIDSIIIHADEALYEGKRSGKNMVVVSED